MRTPTSHGIGITPGDKRRPRSVGIWVGVSRASEWEGPMHINCILKNESASAATTRIVPDSSKHRLYLRIPIRSIAWKSLELVIFSMGVAASGWASRVGIWTIFFWLAGLEEKHTH